MKNIIAASLAIACLTATSAVNAALLTFDSSVDLTGSWNVDIFSGDGTTQWRPGYAPSGGFDGSDGGFVHLNSWDRSNSMQYQAGSFFLGSLEVSSQYAVGGSGVPQGNTAGNDFRMVLYDSALNVLSDAVYFVDPTGAWTTIILNVANVNTIYVEAPGDFSNPPSSYGFWPNFDNILINEVASGESGVPAPGALALLGFGLFGLGWRRRTA